MRIINISGKASAMPTPEPCVVALGNFDGVHVGHAELLRQTVDIAGREHIMSAVFTFDKHPGEVLVGKAAPSIITFEDKLSLFKSFGIDCVYLADFESVRDLSPEDFVEQILRVQMNTRFTVCGFNFRFARGGKGNAEMLVSLMDGNAVVIPPVIINGEPVSSTLIRSAIEGGDTQAAAQMLGRPFFISFPVLHGKQLGRSIGVPTINQSFPENHVIPARGVYACIVTIDGKQYPAISNIGTHPTVDDCALVNCETHIIDFSGWLYAQNIKVEFLKRLRDEKKFPSVDKLTEQIRQDIAEVRKYFNTGKNQ